MPRPTPRNLLRAYTEIGYGNDGFVSTEIEYADGAEVRRRGFIKMHNIVSLYVRVWIGKTVYILSTSGGWDVKKKPRTAVKILLGIGGWVDETIWTQGAVTHV